jgi:F-type H+-transporting ATPase subunit b
MTSLALATAAAAAEGGEHHAPSVTLLLLNFVNFAIYAFILYRFAWPAVTRYLHGRRADVVAALEAAREARAQAEAIKAEYDARLRTLQADAERARAEVLAIAEVEAKNLLEQANRAAERIRNDARLVAEQEVTRARHALQEEAATLVAQVAGELVAKQLTTQDQARFVADFLAQAQETAGESAARAR